MELREKIVNHFAKIYGDSYDKSLIDRIVKKAGEVKKSAVKPAGKWDEKDIILITYGDTIIEKNKPPLQALYYFLQKYLGEEISIVHILPFFPFSSDDGFSITDYLKVNPELGDWKDIQKISGHFQLMFDLVINHISQQSLWFRNYQKGVSPGKDYFIEVDPDTDLSAVIRPRSLPLLSKKNTVRGDKYLWTTFSDDQIDLNFNNPEVLTEIILVFLFYISKGVKIIRLDAIAFLWKKIGSNCLHLPQTHEVVKLMRSLADFISPSLIILTETNVPNIENLSYFGDNDEANMVYQFSLPPLLLYTMFTGNAGYLTQWAKSLPELPEGCTFFNFTASHDGIGVRPLEGLISENNLAVLFDGMKSFGALFGMRQKPDGSKGVYEINITYFDAMKGTIAGFDDYQEKRFLCSQTIAMVLQGVPAFYIHSLLATQNYTEGVNKTGMNRTINRRKWFLDEIFSLLNENSSHSRVLSELKRRLKIRKVIKWLHPSASQSIFDFGPEFFIVSRAENNFLSISNITTKKTTINVSAIYKSNSTLLDLISDRKYNPQGTIELTGYQTLWLTINPEAN